MPPRGPAHAAHPIGSATTRGRAGGEAAALVAAGLWDGAYYLAGYAVECGLKACIMLRVERTGVIFEDRKFAEKCWTHNLEDLLGLAGLEKDRDNDVAADPILALNWDTARKWNEVSRYGRWTASQARALVDAVSDPTQGVLAWVRRRW